jgi:type I restriction enzyme S subunit
MESNKGVDGRGTKLESLIHTLCPNVIEYKTFGEIATISRGASPRPIKNFITKEDGVHWIKIGDVKPGNKYITETEEKITFEGAKKSRFVNIGDFILSNSMSFGRPYIMKIKGCIHDGWLSISDFSKYYNTDFLYYILSSTKYQQIMKQKASFGGAVQNLNADIIRSIELPIIPLPIQEEIVRILNRFDKLCNDISEGLPAEIEARQKQYEYYRDKLLTFKQNN